MPTKITRTCAVTNKTKTTIKPQSIEDVIDSMLTNAPGWTVTRATATRAECYNAAFLTHVTIEEFNPNNPNKEAKK